MKPWNFPNRKAARRLMARDLAKNRLLTGRKGNGAPNNKKEDQAVIDKLSPLLAENLAV